jgi:phasin family protein
MATKSAARPSKSKPVVAKAVAPAAKAMAETAARVVAPVAKIDVPKPVAVAKPAPVRKSDEGSRTMNDTLKTVEDTAKKFTAEAGEKAQAFFADFSTKAKAAFEKSGESMKDAAEFNKGNLEAVVESTKIAAKGAQTAAQNAADYGRKNFDATAALFKSAAAVKSPVELFKLQGDFAKSQFEAVVAEFSKSSEFGLKLAGEVMQPIQNRYAVAVEKVKSFAA